MARVKEFINPNNPNEKVVQEYYIREIYSTCVLGATFQSYNFFQNTEAASLRNYQTGQNFFTSNQGAIKSIQMSFHKASYGGWLTVNSSSYGDVIDEMNKLIEQTQLTLTLDSKPNHVALGNSLSKRMPILVDATQFGTATNVAKPVTPWSREAGMVNRDASTNNWFMKPDLLVAYGRTLQFELKSIAGAISLTALNAAYIKLHLVIEEYPNLNPAQVAA